MSGQMEAEMTSLLDQFASRLAADQKRFISHQTARLKAIGILVEWTVSKTRARACRQYTWKYGTNISKTVYAEWIAKEEADKIVVTRIEYGYLMTDGRDPDDHLKRKDD